MILATAAAVAAYFSQSYHFDSSQSVDLRMEHPFVKEQDKFHSQGAVAHRFTWAGVVAAGLSLACAIAGCFEAANLMMAALPT